MDNHRVTRGYISWLDTVKGLGVYLVIIGHLWYYSNLPVINKGIYSFHMPLFFMIAGFVIRSSDREPITEYIKKQATRILVPAIIFVIVCLPLYLRTTDGLDALTIVRRISFWDGLVPYNDPCWFFIVLFEAKVIERILDIARKKKSTQFAICICSFIVGFMVYYFDIFLPFGLNRCLVAFGFLTIGMVTKDIFLKGRKNGAAGIFWCIVMLLLWFISGIWLNDKISMYGFELGHYWLFALSGICGSFLFIWICQFIDKKVIYLRYVGQNTIFIICTHYICVSVFKKITTVLDLNYTWTYSILAIIFTLILVPCYMLICRFVNKYLPILNGRRNVSK